MATELTESNYQEVTERDGLSVVQFTAPWCVPCRMLAPRLQEMEDDGHFAYFKVDVDENPELAREFRIMSVPTLRFYLNGKSVHTMVGAKPKSQILAEIADFL